ncbi:hypothetical protein Tco_0248361 [Tanacetum coccineum]
MKRGFSGVHIPLFDTMLIHDQPGQGEGPTLTIESQHTPIASPSASQPTISQPMSSQEQPSQGRMTEMEYEEVEIDLSQTDDDLQMRSIIEEIYLGKGFTLQQLTPTKVTQGEEQCQESSEAQLSILSAAKILADAFRERVKTYTKRRSTDSSRDSTARGLFSTAEEVQGKEQISTDEKVAQKLNDKEMTRAAAREKQERIDFEKALEQSDSIKRYQTLKKKPVSVAQAWKNMMIYLKNMAGYKMGYFKGMSYDEIRPIFEEEYC